MSRTTTPEPDAPIPPGVTPDKPKDPSVYGGHWGKTDQTKPGEPPPPDRPDKINPPDDGDQPQPTPTAPPTIR
jgi:hypothetical protein